MAPLGVAIWACSVTVNVNDPGEDSAGGAPGSGETSGGSGGSLHDGSGGDAGQHEAEGGRAVENGGESGSGGASSAGAPPDPDAGESSGGAGGGETCGHGVIEVRSLIDGVDRLTISPEHIWFEHLKWAGPGLESFRTEPTHVAATFGDVTESVLWCPVWENGCNTCDGSCGELRVEGIRSQALCGEFFPGPVSNLRLSCTGAEARSDASCTLVEEPSAANGYQAVVAFDDDLAGGPAYYSARLTFDYGPLPSGECDTGSPPETCGSGCSGSGGTDGSGGTPAGGNAGTSGASGASGMAGSSGEGGFGGSSGNPECAQRGEIEITTLIDGRDRLILTPASIRYEHFSWAGPGMESFRTESTALNVTLGSTISDIDWCPVWENGCNTCDGSCGELREPMNSDPFFWEFFRGCIADVNFVCQGAEGRAYASCVLTQSPAPSNGYTAIIDIDDDFAGGPAYYTARLSFDFAEGAECGCSAP